MLGLTARPLARNRISRQLPEGEKKRTWVCFSRVMSCWVRPGEWLQASLDRQTICFKMGLL